MLNKAILMGRITAEPELRRTKTDIAVCKITIAVDRNFKSGGERETDFIDIVAWRQTAEFICKYFKKGDLIAVDGKIQTRSYTDNQGVKRKAFEVVADNVSFCGGKKETPLDRVERAAKNAGIEVNGDFTVVASGDDLPF